MEAWKEEMYEAELYHHGVLGMKWGVRRYQNYDGTLTRKGMQHLREAQGNYERRSDTYKKAKEAYKSNKSDSNKLELAKAKHNRKVAKRELKDKYKQVKKDYKADQGKDLYFSGKRITDNANKLSAIGAVGSIGIYAAAKLGGQSSKYVSFALGNKTFSAPMAYVAPTAVALGATAVSAVVGAKYGVQNNKLRAYYGHSRKEKRYDYH